MAKKLKVTDKEIWHIASSYVLNNYDWRLYWQDLSQVLQELRGKK